MEIGLNKILLFPDKLKALLNSNEDNPDFLYPISVELSLTNECNQKCIWCSDYELRNRLPGTLKKEVIFNLVDDLKIGGTKGITIEGGGEPTLHPDFIEIINYIYDKGLGVGLITNGVILNYEDILHKFDWIRISLDAANSNEYKKLKGTNNFDTVINNIKKIAQKTNVCGIGYIITQDNINHLEELTIILKEIGVKYIHFRPVIDNPDLYIETNLDYLKHFENKDFSIIADALQENKVRGNNGVPCYANSLVSIISASGDVFICGRLNVYEWLKPIGNINNQKFKDIWNGEERIKQIRKVLDNKFCNRYCPECRITKYNILIDKLKKIKTKNFI
ncbi:MAG TPA: radical SAM protein [bacterium]|nr:radical SAM protein [bacterium]HOL47823.1 radical SAM protein [bacterium]HPQ19941.1 radical SAM protein [bacterium]